MFAVFRCVPSCFPLPASGVPVGVGSLAFCRLLRRRLSARLRRRGDDETWFEVRVA